MTNKQSTARLILYILIAMVTSASAGIQTVDFANFKEVIAFVLGIVATGLVTARSYIDQSPNQVVPETPPALRKETPREPQDAG